MPTAGILVGREEVFEQGVIPISKIKPITSVAKLPRQISQPIVIPDIDIGRIREPTVDIIREQPTDIVQDIVRITVPDYQPRPGPTPQPPPPFVPIGGLFIPSLDFFGGERIYRKRGRVEQAFGFTGDFIASVRNEFAKQPRQRLFTGQERRYKVRGREFVSPLPKRREGIIQLVARQLGG